MNDLGIKRKLAQRGSKRRRRQEAYEAKNGRRADESRECVRKTLQSLKDRTGDTKLTLLSDEKASYGTLVREVFGALAVHETTPGTAPRTAHNPLFPINTTLAMTRDNNGRLRRRSWLVSKECKCLIQQAQLFLVYRNYMRRRFNYDGAEETPAKLLGLLPRFRNQGINEALSEACRKMAEGEVLQLYYNGNPLMPEPEYLRIIEHKTAGLIAASCKIGAIVAGATEELQEALFRFGQRLGIAFQLADDTLDYTANGEHLGKTLGQDLRQGKATLPLLHLLQHCSEPDRQLIKDRMETRTLTDEELRRIVALMQEYGSIAYAMERAHAFVAAAKRDLDLFHDNTAKRALSIAADYMVTRDR